MTPAFLSTSFSARHVRISSLTAKGEGDLFFQKRDTMAEHDRDAMISTGNKSTRIKHNYTQRQMT